MDIDRTSTHYKGVFVNIYEVNKKFPNGGTDGDYVEIDGWAHYWNADRGTWCVNADRDSYWDEKLSALKSYSENIYNSISGEATERKKADDALDKKVSDEASARSTADANIQTTLQGNIDAEAKARADADSSIQTTLQGNIDAEAKTRADAVTLLQGNIDALAQSGYRFLGIATPETDPGNVSTNVFYIATQAGTYSHFGTGLMKMKKMAAVKK